MKVHYKRFVTTISVCGLFLAGSFGCAQGNVNLKDQKLADAAVLGVLQAVNISADGTRLDISADKPLTYTFYKTSAPPKAVIDLAQTEAGSIRSPIEVDRGNIKRIDVTKHDFGGSFLTRIEVIMKGEGGAVVSPVTDKNRLQVVFSAEPEAEKKETKEAPVSDQEVKSQAEVKAAPPEMKEADATTAKAPAPVAPPSGQAGASRW